MCVTGWLIGVAVAALRLITGAAHVRKLRRSGLSAVSDEVRHVLAAAAERLGVTRVVEIAQSTLVSGPVVIGWLKPLVLLPAASLNGLTMEQLEAVLAHELAHVRRLDYLANLLQTIVETVFFYHPAVWWVSRRMRIHREDCCDDRAVRAITTPLTYASALLKLHELRDGVRVPASAICLSATGGSLKKRIHRVLGLDEPLQTAPTWRLAAGIAGLLIVVAGCGLLADDAQIRLAEEARERQRILAAANSLQPPVPDDETGLLPPANTPEEREQVLQQLDDLGVKRWRALGITPNRGPGAKVFTAKLWDAPDEAWPHIGRLRTIHRLNMTACRNSPEAFRHVAGLRSLRNITVINSRFDTRHLEALAPSEMLQELDVMLTVFQPETDRQKLLGELSPAEQKRFDRLAGPDRSKDHIAEAAILTDRALTKLSGLKNLQKLCLVNTYVSNVGVQALAEMKSLQHVDIDVWNPINRESAALFGSLPNLEELYLGGNIDAESAAGLASAPTLTRLELRAIDDSVAEVVADISTLEWLRIWASPLSNEGLLDLAKLPKLKHLDLRNGFSGTVTLAGIKQFQEARPGCEVLHDFKVETLKERKIALPDDHFLISLRWNKAPTRDLLAKEMQQRFGDSKHWIEFRPYTRSGYVGGIALLKGTAGRDWLVQQLEQDGDFRISFVEPLTYDRLKTEGVMFESFLKPRQEKAREYEARRRAGLKLNAEPVPDKTGSAATVVPTEEPLPPLEELVGRLNEHGHKQVAKWLDDRHEYLRGRIRDETTAVIAYGQVVAPPGVHPRLCDAQMKILDGGCFVDIIGDKDRAVAFRMFGCQPVDIVPSRVQPEIRAGETLSLGRIVMEPYPVEELATVRGQLKFEGDTPPTGILMRIVMQHGRANSASGGTDGFLEWPEKENVTLSDDLQFEHRKLAPIPHQLRIEALGFRTVMRDLEPGARATLDLGTIEIPKSVRLRVELLASETRDFAQAERRELTVQLRESWRAAPFNPELAKYSGGDMMFRLRSVDPRDPASEERVHFATGVSSLKVAHLGEGALDDFLEQSGNAPRLLRDRQVPIESGNVYLTYHTHWKHWTLARVTVVSDP